MLRTIIDYRQDAKKGVGARFIAPAHLDAGAINVAPKDRQDVLVVPEATSYNDSAMKVDRELVLHIAKLAHIELSDAEIELFTTQLASILQYVEKLNEVTEPAEPFVFGDFLTLPLREDLVSPSLPVRSGHTKCSRPQEKSIQGTQDYSMIDFQRTTIHELLEAYRTKQTSPREICEELFKRIDQHDAGIGAFLRIDRGAVLQQATDSEKHSNRPLWGVPLAIKDNISTQGQETTCSSKILQGYIPPYDATVIARLKDAGAIILGKTNCDEFAMGSSTENSAFQCTRNPWNREHTPGGSSGGSAAAVASGFTFGALGSDTGGSVRQPAAMCGVIGMKPTYGRVSRYGLVAFGSSLDCIGTLTRSAEDAALLLRTIAGSDLKDSTCSAQEVPDYILSMKKNGKPRVGLPREYFGEGMDAEVASAIETSLQSMERAGKIELRSISLPHTEYAIAAYYVIATAEASSNLSRFDGVRYGYRANDKTLRKMYARTRAEGFGAEVKRRIMLGTFALSAGYYDAYYMRASKVRSLIAEDFRKAFEEVDLICTPTSPGPAFKLGEKINEPLSMYLSDVYTVTMNLAGVPAISIPCGLHTSGLPIGLQIIGNYLDETGIFSFASTYLKEFPLSFPEL